MNTRHWSMLALVIALSFAIPILVMFTPGAFAENTTADDPCTWARTLLLAHTLLALIIVTWTMSAYWRITDPRPRSLLITQGIVLLDWTILDMLRLDASAQLELALRLASYVPILMTPIVMLALVCAVQETNPLKRPRWERGATGVGSLLRFGPLTPALTAPSLGALVRAALVLGAVALGAIAQGAVALGSVTQGPFVSWAASTCASCEMTLFALVLVLAAAEASIRSGKIPTARNYRTAFTHSCLPVQILDKNRRVLASTQGDNTRRHHNTRTKNPAHMRACEHEIPSGTLLWYIDHCEIAQLQARLDRTRTRLIRSHDTLARQHANPEVRKELARRTSILNAFDAIADPMIDRVRVLGEELPQATATRRARILRMISVDLAYIKYVGPLLLGTVQAEDTRHGSRLPDVEKALTRMCENLSADTHLCALVPLCRWDSGWVRSEVALAGMDFAHRVLWCCAERDGAEILIRVGIDEGGLDFLVMLETEGPMPLECLEDITGVFPSAAITIEDDRVRIRLRVGEDDEPNLGAASLAQEDGC